MKNRVRGFGEPTEAFDVLKEVASYVKKTYNKPIRINTNGVGNLINKRDIVPEMEGLLITCGADKKDIFFKLKVPQTLPYFFSAIKMAIPLSILGAAMGEWLGAQSGLGYFSKRMMTQLDGAGVFAPVVVPAGNVVTLLSDSSYQPSKSYPAFVISFEVGNFFSIL